MVPFSRPLGEWKALTFDRMANHGGWFFNIEGQAVGDVLQCVNIMAVNFLWLLPIAFFAEVFQGYGALLLILAALPLLVGQHLCGAGRLKPTLAVLAR